MHKGKIISNLPLSTSSPIPNQTVEYSIWRGSARGTTRFQVGFRLKKLLDNKAAYELSESTSGLQCIAQRYQK